MNTKSLLTGTLLAVALTGCAYPTAPVAVAAPPPPPAEVVGVAPGPGYFWVRGHYAWRYGRYVWIRGHWAVRGTGVWVEGHYANNPGGYVWVEGHWQ